MDLGLQIRVGLAVIAFAKDSQPEAWIAAGEITVQDIIIVPTVADGCFQAVFVLDKSLGRFAQCFGVIQALKFACGGIFLAAEPLEI